MRKHGIPTSCIYSFLATQASGYEIGGDSRIDIYNEKFKGFGAKNYESDW